LYSLNYAGIQRLEILDPAPASHNESGSKSMARKEEEGGRAEDGTNVRVV
jgi:hypothetical protein